MIIRSIKLVHNANVFCVKTSNPPDLGGLDADRWFWDAENISGAQKHNLLCSLEHKFPVPRNYYTFLSFLLNN